MAARNEHYRIKLLGANNVVLVEADKYDSEIFTPKIVNGRITFLNIIPNRRCCQITKSNVMNYVNNVSQDPRKHLKELNVGKSGTCGRLSDGQSPAFNLPLANSTPLGVKPRSSCISRLSHYSSCINAVDSTLPTPEPIRKAVPAHPMPLEKSMFCMTKSVRVSKIYRNTTEQTPKKVGRSTQSSINSSFTHYTANVSVLNDSFRSPCSPSTSSQCRSRTSAAKYGVDSISCWQKVLTPVRTYTRNSNKAVMIRRPVLINSAKKQMRDSRYKPTFLVNPTKGPNVTQRIEVKKRKIIIDTKICISPRTFKKQQKEPLDGNTGKTTSLHPNSLSFHKPRAYLDSIGMSAFDLLTNSNRKRIMANKLNEQFRKNCVNKASSTYSKYKILSTVPPLQHDNQVLELSSISLPNS